MTVTVKEAPEGQKYYDHTVIKKAEPTGRRSVVPSGPEGPDNTPAVGSTDIFGPEQRDAKPEVAKSTEGKAAYQAKPGQAGSRLPAPPRGSPAKPMAAELDRVLASGEIDPGTHQLAKYLVE